MADSSGGNASGNWNCSIGVFSDKPCNSSNSSACENKIVKLRECVRDIFSHLNRVGLCKGIRQEADVSFEGQLISTRVGIFKYDEELSVCPYHRESLGLRWYRPRSCCYPNHPGKEKPFIACSTTMSRTLLYEEGILVQIGAGVCLRCYKKFVEKYQPVTGDISGGKGKEKKEHIVDTDGINQRQKKQGTLESPFVTDLDMDSFDNSQTQSTCSAYSQESISALKEKCGGLETANKVISMLSSNQMSPLRGQLQTDWDATAGRTKRYYKRKAEEGIDYLLEMIVPGQSSHLKHMRFDQGVQSGLEIHNLTSTIVRMIDNTENNALKIQLTGILSTQIPRANLLNLLPNLSEYQFYKAKKVHSTSTGMTVSAKEVLPRQRLDGKKMQHAISFFMDPSFIQPVSYGTRELKLESGEVLTIPDVVRTVCHSQIIDLYFSYCKENEFDPLGKSTLFNLLKACAAAKRTNLQGLDNIAADGNEAFKIILENTETKLSQYEISKDKQQRMKEMLLKLRNHLKSTYKFHCNLQETCSDHCIQWLLSDPDRDDFKTKCDHVHNTSCQLCDSIRDLAKELHGSHSQELERIYDWKRHIVRTINQDQSRLNILNSLEHNQVLLIMDWAMKFLPRKYREKQSDWFGQRGKNWHVSVAIFKVPTGELCHRTYTHIFENVKQDWFCVASILEHTLQTIHEQMPDINEVFVRSDNAGCYHCAPLWLTIPGISERTGLWIRNYCYSEAQSGKSYCDAKIAHMRTKMKTYVATGKDITTALDMKAAIDHGKGVGGCQVCVGTIDVTKQTLFGHKMKDVSKYTDIDFHGGSLTVKKAYGIGQGMKISRLFLNSISEAQKETGFTLVSDFCCPQKTVGSISNTAKDNAKSDKLCDNNQFLCTEDGCTDTLDSYEALINHVTLGLHKIEILRESSFDKVKRQWAKHCNEIEIKDKLHFLDQNECTEGNAENTGLPQGWALKVTKARPRFPQHVREFLQEKFNEGENNGRKVTPQDVEREMKCLVSKSGQHIFNEKECLSVAQITSFFSRVGNLSTRSFKKISNKSDDEIIGCLTELEENEVLESIQI